MDREKVIKGIDICLQRFHCGEDCPYYNVGCMEQLREDAIALLQKQEDKIRQLRLALQILNGNGIKVDTEGR